MGGVDKHLGSAIIEYHGIIHTQLVQSGFTGSGTLSQP
jgi:hypothetical protein